MQCKKCKKNIPFFASKCNHCHRDSGWKLPEHSEITEDMFEQRVIRVPVDYSKKTARQNYLDTLPEYKELNAIVEAQRPKRIGFGKSLLKIMLILIISFALIFGGLLFVKTTDSETLKTFMPVIVGGVIVVYVIFATTDILKRGKKKRLAAREKVLRLHDVKGTYYANQNVFGYIKYDHMKSFTRKVGEDDYETYYKHYYAYYEIEKRNIKSITYDPYYAEYVVIMNKPVYYDYNFAPTVEFRIQDVFDDTELSNALERNLPPKNIRF